MWTIYLFLLILGVVNGKGNDSAYIFYPKRISSPTLAKLYLQDKNSTIANTVVFEKNDIIFAGSLDYLLKDMLNDVGTKKINLVLQRRPEVGWVAFSNYLRTYMDRLTMEIAPIVGPGPDLTVDYDRKYPVKNLTVLIVRFAECEEPLFQYTPPMIYEMEKYFNREKPVVQGRVFQQWLKLNAIHVQNMKEGLVIEKKNFLYLDGKLVIYQRHDRGPGTSNREAVLKRLSGFKSSDIIWDRILTEKDNPLVELSRSRRICREILLNFTVTFLLLMLIN